MRVHLVGVAAATLAGVCLRFQDETRPDERVDAIARDALSEDVDGLSIAIAVGPDLDQSGGWGYADAGRKEPATADTLYRAGCLTSPLVRIAALQLVERGRIALDDRVEKLLPDLELASEGVTLAQLLRHTSGIPGYSELLRGQSEIDPARVREWLARQPLDANPGECRAYSETNILLLGWIVEKVSGETVPEYLAANVFGPAGMDSTGYRPLRRDVHRLAEITQELDGKNRDQTGSPQPFDAERLCTTAPDVVSLLRAVVGRKLIGEASFELLSTPLSVSGDETVYADTGVEERALQAFSNLSFGGSMGGCSVHAAYYPAMDLSIAVLATGFDASVHGIEHRLARVYFRIPEPGIHDVALTAEERRTYLGDYYIGCDYWTIFESGDHIALRSPFGKEYVLHAQGMQIFLAADDPEVRVTFEVVDGVATGFVLDDHGASSRARRIS